LSLNFLCQKWGQVQIDRNSPYYRQPEKMWDFYARSWALSHMLLLGHRYAPHFSEFMAGLAEGQPAENVLRAVYGQDFAMLDRDLKIYVDEGGFRSTSCARVNPPRAPGPFKSRPASDAELNVILADLVSVHSPQYAGLEAKLQSISQASVPNPAVEEALGYLALWKGRLDQARLYFASAVNHGLKNGDTILRYAELEQSSGASSNQILAILRRAVASNPNNDTARLKLGWTAAKMKDYALAISALSEIKIVLPQQACVILYTLAYSYAKSDRLDECMEVGIRARQNAKTITEQRQLEQLLRYADWKRAARLSTPLLASSDTRVNALSPRASASAAPSADFGRAKP
jgi:tetratricopeptide (TPR) repeat protein